MLILMFSEIFYFLINKWTDFAMSFTPFSCFFAVKVLNKEYRGLSLLAQKAGDHKIWGLKVYVTLWLGRSYSALFFLPTSIPIPILGRNKMDDSSSEWVKLRRAAIYILFLPDWIRERHNQFSKDFFYFSCI